MLQTMEALNRMNIMKIDKEFVNYLRNYPNLNCINEKYILFGILEFTNTLNSLSNFDSKFTLFGLLIIISKFQTHTGERKQIPIEQLNLW